MPRYEYRCVDSGEVVEVSHGMSERLTTWGELCERAGMQVGTTPAGAPVEKIISLSSIGAGSARSGPMPGGGSCGLGCGCHRN